MNNKVQNPKVNMPETMELNDENFLTEILECEKNMSVNMTIALNETSNDNLYNELFPIFEDIKNCQRKIFNLAFKKGFYSLEKADKKKIFEKTNELSSKMSQLIQ